MRRDWPMEDLRFCRFMMEDRTPRFGLIRGQVVHQVSSDPFGPMEETGLRVPLEEVRLLPPVTPPYVYCVGRNYVEHAEELGNRVPEEPLIFMKPGTCVVGPQDPVRIPLWVGRVDYEGELAVVIRRRCRNVSEEEALDFVLGYTGFNDVTARDLQRSDGQWTRAKGFDTFGPMGPCLRLVRDWRELGDLVTRLNGRQVQLGQFRRMAFPVERIIAHVSRFATLMPGDVIATGTPAGVGPLSPGDRVEVEIGGIGCLSNPCEADL